MGVTPGANALAQQLLDFGIRGFFGIALIRPAGIGVRLRLGRAFLGGARFPLARAAAALLDLDVAENAADRLADRLPFEPLLYRLADLVHGLARLLGIGEQLLDLGSDGRPVERALDANRHGKTGKVVGAALSFGSRHDLGIGEEVHSALDQVHGAGGRYFHKRARRREIARLGNAVLDGEATAEIGERGLGVRPLAQLRDFASADLIDHLGEVYAFDRAVAHGNAALTGKGRLDLVAVVSRAAELKRELGASFEQAHSGGIGQEALDLNAIEQEVAVESGNLFRRIEHELAGRMSVIEVHVAERGAQDAVAEGKTKRTRSKLEVEDAGLAHIEIDVGIERRGR